MLFIIDANEFIFAIGQREDAAKKLLDNLLTKATPHSVRIPRTVFIEVKRNLSPEAFREFILLLFSANIIIDEDELVPFAFGSKYKSLGLKLSDAFIAAYAEWVGADIIVSENRHFLSLKANLPFKVLTAESCLKLIKSSLRK
ncbi:MAG: PIN domain-containing protein [Candidatus Omnitrophota bacterium]